jgi:N6-adenosine-specific RNA methylase IME4
MEQPMTTKNKTAAPVIQKPICGATKGREVCNRDPGHVGMHTNGGNVTWKDKKPAEAAAAPAPTAAPKPKKEKPDTRDTATKLADAGYCGASFQGNAVLDKFVDLCTLPTGHEGPHENTSTGIKEVRAIDVVFAPPKGQGAPIGKAKGRKVHNDEVAAPAGPKPEQIGTHQVHPAAALFPMIGEVEWPSFLDDIRTNGQRKKIVRILVGNVWAILDGRNRLKACLELKIEPLFRTFGDEANDGSDPIAFVVSENIHRRHLNETQRAFVGAELVPMYEAAAKERMVAGKKDPTLNSGQGRAPSSAELAARAVNVGKASIEAALKVNREGAPEVIDAARNRGQIKVSTAANLVNLPQHEQQEIVQKIGGGELRSGKVRAYVNQAKKRAIVRNINEQRVAPMPDGPFGVIYGDYPWHYDNSDQHEGSRGHLGYATMKMEEIIAHALETAKRAATDCVIALWGTNLYITKMDPVLNAYGADPERRTVFTWPKQKAGVGSNGRGQTEHLVVTFIGRPVHTLNELSTLLPSWAPEHPGEHSSKPAEVAAMLAKHCSGPFLELFARGPRGGWETWGAESQKFVTEAA